MRRLTPTIGLYYTIIFCTKHNNERTNNYRQETDLQVNMIQHFVFSYGVLAVTWAHLKT